MLEYPNIELDNSLISERIELIQYDRTILIATVSVSHLSILLIYYSPIFHKEKKVVLLAKADVAVKLLIIKC